jgi:tyrosine-protein kinase
MGFEWSGHPAEYTSMDRGPEPASSIEARLGKPVPADWSPRSATLPLSRQGSAFGSYTRALRAQSAVAVTLFVLVLAVAVVYALARSPSYQATARLVINPLPQTNTAYTGLPLIRDSGDPTTNMETAATLLDSPAAAGRAAKSLRAGWTRLRVQHAISVQPEGQSLILDITATGDSAREAAHVANVYTNSVLALRARALRASVAQAIASTQSQLAAIKNPASVSASVLESNLNQLQALTSGQDPTVSLTQAAVAPTSSSGTSRSMILLLGLIAAIALASGAALLIELLRARRVTDEDQLATVVPAPVIGRIPLYGRRGRTAAGPAELPPAVGEALRMIRIQLDLLPGRHRTILITSASHGDGKTTTTVNLARELEQSGARVLIIDADLRKPDVGERLGVRPRVSLSRALESSDPLAAAQQPPAGSERLQVLAATPDPDFQTLDRVAHALKGALEQILQEVDYVLLDAPPLGEVADILRFIRVVDDVLLVSRLGHTKLGNLEVVRELLEIAGKPATGHVSIGASPRQAPPYGYYQTAPARSAKSPEPPPEAPVGRRRREPDHSPPLH